MQNKNTNVNNIYCTKCFTLCFCELSPSDQMDSTRLYKFKHVFVLQLEDQKFSPEMAKFFSQKIFSYLYLGVWHTSKQFSKKLPKRRGGGSKKLFLQKLTSERIIYFSPCVFLHSLTLALSLSFSLFLRYFFSLLSLSLSLYIYIYLLFSQFLLFLFCLSLSLYIYILYFFFCPSLISLFFLCL